MATRSPPAAKGMPRTKFGNIEFPGEVHRLLLVGRHFVHEYPHTPGGAPEKLGRGLWRCTVRANFQATFPGYPDLYPNSMNTMQGYAALQATLPFTHPSAGTWPAFIVRWEQEKRGSLRSGEKVEIEFLEDQASSFALADVAVRADDTSVATTWAQVQQEIAAIRAQLQLSNSDVTVLQAIDSAVNSVLAYRDTVDKWNNRYAAAVDHLLSLAGQLDRAASMQDPRAWPVVAALRQMQGAAVRIKRDLQAQRQTLSKYVVPATMPISQVAVNLFGDASKQSDLLALNVVADPVFVRAGTSLVYYPLTAQQRAAQGI